MLLGEPISEPRSVVGVEWRPNPARLIVHLNADVRLSPAVPRSFHGFPVDVIAAPNGGSLACSRTKVRSSAEANTDEDK
jgi:hypothetical protein